MQKYQKKIKFHVKSRRHSAKKNAIVSPFENFKIKECGSYPKKKAFKGWWGIGRRTPSWPLKIRKQPVSKNKNGRYPREAHSSCDHPPDGADPPKRWALPKEGAQ